MKRLLNDRGDTIAEVLIVVAIISSILLGAFTVTQRSVKTVRDSQEYAEGLNLLQGQVELVRDNALKAADTQSGVFSDSTPYFCINASTTPATIQKLNGLTTLPSLESDNFASYQSACGNINGRYNVAVHYNRSSNVFEFHQRWDSVNGSRQQINLSYRIYPGQPTAAATMPTGGAPAPTPTPPPVNGNALVGYPPCTPNPATGVCDKSTEPPRYRWNQYPQNQTITNGLTITGCVWDWGDSKQDINKACAPGSIIKHSYDPPAGYETYDKKKCWLLHPNLTLTVYFDNGTSSTTVKRMSLPDCW